MLTHFGGMAQNRLAGELGLSFSGAKSRVQRARKMLKDMLLECCHLEFDRRGSIIGYESVEPECAACNKEAPGQNSMRPIAGTCVY